MRNLPVTQSDRPTTITASFSPPAPIHEYARFFRGRRVFRHATAHPLHTGTRLYSVCEYKIEVIRKEPSRGLHGFDGHVRYQGMSISDVFPALWLANIAFSSPVTHSFSSRVYFPYVHEFLFLVSTNN